MIKINKKSSVFNNHFIKYLGFTLAEVLIVIGIIGIIAEVTLPSLISNLQSEIFKSEFKKTYSTFSQAITKAQTELGFGFGCFYWPWDVKQQMFGFSTSSCQTYDANGDCTKYCACPEGFDCVADPTKCNDYGTSNGLTTNWNGNVSQCSDFSTWFANNMNISKYCASNAYANGCIPYYNGIDTIQMNKNSTNENYQAIDAAKATSGLKRWRQSNILNNSEAYVLRDGSIVIVYNKFQPPTFLVDINGKEKPNKWGYDLFTFTIFGTGMNTALKFSCMNNNALVVEDNGQTCMTIYKQVFNLPANSQNVNDPDE